MGIIEQKLKEVGITLNGTKPHDVQVHNPKFLDRILKEQSIGAGESYVDGWWDCERLDELFFLLCRNQKEKQFYSKLNIYLTILKNAIVNQQSREKSEDVARVHYNIGNKLYERMLGKSMAYTCGYWKEAKSLDEAQFAKYELICKKLYLKPKEKVLELGCGFGGLAKYIAQNYDCEVVAIDIGQEPSNYAKKHCEGLPVTVHQADYRDIDVYNPKSIQFDKIVSVGVLEHIGYKNYDKFLNIAHAFLKKDGIFLLHSIGGDTSKNYCDAWIDKYIFPHGMLPSLKQLGHAFEKKFKVEDLHNFSAYYDKTLLAWHENLTNNWPELKDQYNEKFHRMMNYYLLSCAGSFRARSMQLWQFVLTPHGMLNGYQSFR